MSKQELAKQLVNTYSKITPSAPSSWVVFSDDERTEDHRWLDICHARLFNMDVGLYDQLMTAVPCDSDLDLSYITYLIDGPFRAFRDRISLETIEVQGPAGDDQKKYYLHCTKLDTWPANVLYNFCIASRTPIEFDFIVKAWGQLVSAKVDEALAFQVASRLAFRYKGNSYRSDRPVPLGDPWDWKLDVINCPMGHFWFDPTANWKNIMDGTPVLEMFTNNYKDNTEDCTPCNVIWGMSDPETTKKLVGKTVKELSQHFGLIPSDEEVKAKSDKDQYLEKLKIQIAEMQEAEVEDDDDFDFDDDWPDDAENGDDIDF